MTNSTHKIAGIVLITFLGSVLIAGVYLFHANRYSGLGSHQFDTIAQTEKAVTKAQAYTQFLLGVMLEKKGRYEQASEKFRLAKELDPDSTRIRAHLGVSLSQIGKTGEAGWEFNEAARASDPEKVRHLVALMLIKRKQYERALEQYRLILEEAPDNRLALSSIADIYVLTNRLTEAIDIYRRLTELAPEIGAYHFNKAIIESRLFRYKDAQDSLQNALNLDPESQKIRFALALIHEAQRNFEEARQLYEEILSLNTVDPRVFHNLARLNLREGLVAEALENYASALKVNPRDLNAALDAAMLCIQSKRYELASNIADIPLDAGIKHHKLYFMKGFSAQERGLWEEALLSYREAVIVSPDYADGHFYLGVAYDKTGDKPSAVKHLQKTIELDSENSDAYNYLGYLKIESGVDIDGAIELIQEALHLEPHNAAYIDSLGWAYFKKGLFDRAVAELERAIAMDSSDTVIRRHLFDAYRKIGEEDKAHTLIDFKSSVSVPQDVNTPVGIGGKSN